MNKFIRLLMSGLVLFILGISISTHWVILGTTFAIIGGFMMGGSSYFLINEKFLKKK